MKIEVIQLKLTSDEPGLIITALNALRNKRIAEGKSIEFVNEVFMKFAGE